MDKHWAEMLMDDVPYKCAESKILCTTGRSLGSDVSSVKCCQGRADMRWSWVCNCFLQYLDRVRRSPECFHGEFTAKPLCIAHTLHTDPPYVPRPIPPGK